MRSLIQRTLDAGVPVNQSSPTGTALFHTVKHHNLDTALFLLSKDADPKVDPSADECDWTMLHHCLYKKDRMETRTQLVRKVVSYGVDVGRYATEFPDADPDEVWMHIGPPLYFAAFYAERIECMKILLDAGADPSDAVICTGRGDEDVDDGDIHPTLCALFGVYCWWQPGARLNQMREQACLLLERGYSLDYGGTGDFAGCPLDWATRTELTEAVKLMLDNASSTNISFGHLMYHIRHAGEDHEAECEEIRRMLVEFRQREFAGFETDGEEDNWEVGGGDSEEEEEEEEGEEEE
jgi:ankyrin repeat protein